MCRKQNVDAVRNAKLGTVCSCTSTFSPPVTLVQVTRRTGRAVTMWLRYAAAAVALAAVLGGVLPAPVDAAKASSWQLRRLTASSEDSEVRASCVRCIIVRCINWKMMHGRRICLRWADRARNSHVCPKLLARPSAQRVVGKEEQVEPGRAG